jgi:hypothetical protein
MKQSELQATSRKVTQTYYIHEVKPLNGQRDLFSDKEEFSASNEATSSQCGTPMALTWPLGELPQSLTSRVCLLIYGLRRTELRLVSELVATKGRLTWLS